MGVDMMRTYRFIGALLILLCPAIFGETHIWTSREGKTAVAEFQALEGGTLVLKKGSKTIRVPLDGFTDGDQTYARKCAEELKAKVRRLEEERLERIGSLKGLRRSVPVTARRWEDWKDYYTESTCGRDMLDFFKNERSIVDVRNKGVFISVEDAVRPPGYAPTMAVYCPSDYDGKEKMGIYIHVSPGNNATVPNQGYRELMDKYRLVCASPNGSGNDQSDMRRCALALDTLAQLREDYAIDEDRIYIGGTSGGGAEATFATFLYPQDFRAALNSVRYFLLTSNACLPFADRSHIREASKHQQPFAFISGPDDSNYNYMPDSEQSFKDHGFVVKFFDIPGMGHETASAETFDKVMQWVEDNNPRLK